MNARAVVLVLSFWGPTILAAQECQEWAAFDLDATDHEAGAFFDRNLGVYVAYSIGGRPGRAPWPPDVVSSTRVDVGSHRYVVQHGGDARAATIKEIESSFGFPLSALGRVASRQVAPEGSSLVVVRREGASTEQVTYSAAVCSDAQRERLMVALRGGCLDPGRQRESKRPRARAMTLGTYEGLQQELGIEELVKALGQPTATYQPGCQGVALVFPLRLEGSDRLYEAIVEMRAGTGLSGKWIEGPIGIKPTK